MKLVLTLNPRVFKKMKAIISAGITLNTTVSIEKFKGCWTMY